MKLKEGAAFIVLMLSASAMDSDVQIIPGLMAITALLILSGRAVKKSGAQDNAYQKMQGGEK